MSAFRDQTRQFTLRVEEATQTSMAAIVAATQASIVEGSAVTGSPGQPVDTGALRASWILDWLGPMQAMISTNLPYALSIEDGLSYAHNAKPMVLRSAVGGWHSVRQTVQNFDWLARAAVAAGGPTHA